MPRKLGIRPWFLRDRQEFSPATRGCAFRHGGDHPGGNLPISAIRTLTGTVGFMSGVAGEIRPTPCTKLAAAPVEETTGVFTAT